MADITSSSEPGPLVKDFYNSRRLRLKKYDIRILTLHPELTKGIITCTLDTRSLLPAPAVSMDKLCERSQQPHLDCNTLSYQWRNDRKILRKILCNETEFLVTDNLYSALFHLREREADVNLWIDAICINQQSNSEKENQVQRMEEIYSSSERTIIWLGDGSFWSREAFRACSIMASRYRNEVVLSKPTTVSFAWDPLGIFRPFLVLLLLRQNYFRRMWIIQEVALSRKIEVVCGKDRISWWNFVIGATTVLVSGLGSRGAMGMGNILVARAMVLKSAMTQSDPACIFQALTRDKLPQANNILAMAILFRRSNATDPVDKLFGLLGLCKYIHRRGAYGILPVYAPHNPYHKNQVYIHAARTIASSQNNLHIFSAVNRRPPCQSNIFVNLCRRVLFKESALSGDQEALPSWVPDWSDAGNMATPLSLMLAQNESSSNNNQAEHELNSAPIVSTSHAVSYRNALKTQSTKFLITGSRVDDIIFLGEVCNTEKAQTSFSFSIRYAFNMSENHRLEIFSRWESQFRTTAPNDRFWENFIHTITCSSDHSYAEQSVLRLLADFHSRGPRNLPKLVQSVFIILFILPFTIISHTWSGFLERAIIYWCFPVLAFSLFWHWCFRLTPNFMFQDRWGDVDEGFLKSDFDHMELRKLARLKFGSLALVPEASCIGDEIWIAEGGVVPLVLRRYGHEFELVGECYFPTAAKLKREQRAKSKIYLV